MEGANLGHGSAEIELDVLRSDRHKRLKMKVFFSPKADLSSPDPRRNGPKSTAKEDHSPLNSSKIGRFLDP